MFNIDIYISDQARGQDGWILAKFSFFVLMHQDEVDVHQNAKRKPGQYPAILTELARSIWQAPRAGKMGRILCSDRLPVRARRAN